MERVLVTGGAGFIGGWVVEKLVSMGCEVSVLDNLTTGTMENLQHLIDARRVAFFEGDVQDEDLVWRLVRGADAVVHLAAVTSVPFSVGNPVLTNRVNVGGTLNLLQTCLSNDVERFLLISSCAVYGEPQYFPVDERHPTCPLSPYAVSKLAAEHYCQAFNHAYGLDTVVLRLFNVYGPGQRRGDLYSGVITRFIENLFYGRPMVVYGDGSQTRDFVHVQDVAEAVWLALNVSEAEGQIFNLGYGRPVEINELAKNVVELADAHVEVKYRESRVGDLEHSHADVTKARMVLGYEPKIQLQAGLQSLLRERREEFLTSRGVLQSSTPVIKG